MLTGLLGRVLHEERGDVFVHPHLVLGDAGVGSGVLVPDTADQQLSAIRYKETALTLAQGRHLATRLPANTLYTQRRGVTDERAGFDLRWGFQALMHSCSDYSIEIWEPWLSAAPMGPAI